MTIKKTNIKSIRWIKKKKNYNRTHRCINNIRLKFRLRTITLTRKIQ